MTLATGYTPAALPPMPSITIGARLGPYEILDAIGAGGMGEVYRARDTRLDRTVAIKVLASGLASDVQSRVRFERVVARSRPRSPERRRSSPGRASVLAPCALARFSWPVP